MKAMPTLEQCEKWTGQNFQDQMILNDGNMPEAHHLTNALSRATVRAYRREKGEVWLYRLNAGPILQKYERGMIFNFGASGVVPEHSNRLVTAIEKYRAAGPGQDALAAIDAALDIVTAMDGDVLIWT